jgi:LacI family transcriptional regulator
VPTELVTLGDVAAHAGVSKATASKVFNGRSDVATSTRERVSRAAAELGYVPPVRPPAPGVTQVWVAFNRVDNAYSAAVLEGLLAEAHGRDAVVIVTEWGTAGDHQPLPGSPAWIRQAQDRGAQAFILVTTPITKTHEDASRQLDTP